MGIDPSSELTEPFYGALRGLDFTLLTHTGRESAIDAHHQNLGNPLLLRKALDSGVRVVALHSASHGTSADFETPGNKEVPSFDLFLRLMDEPKYEGLLFGEISAMTFFNHLPRPLTVLLERQDLHHRLVNGSDYPIPGVNIATQTKALVREGFITEEERLHLNDIYGYNPLLFDFVVKRTVRHPTSGEKFAPEVFVGLEKPSGARGPR